MTTTSSPTSNGAACPQVAWAYLRREPLPAAIARFREGLRRFARAQGRPGLYHEAMTVAYLLWIPERVARSPARHSFARFAARNRDLCRAGPSALDRFHRLATLRSRLARRVFLIMPDRLAPTPTEPGSNQAPHRLGRS